MGRVRAAEKSESLVESFDKVLKRGKRPINALGRKDSRPRN